MSNKIILASAGTGKTTRLLQEHGMVVSFARSTANHALTRQASNARTLHSICFEMLRKQKQFRINSTASKKFFSEQEQQEISIARNRLQPIPQHLAEKYEEYRRYKQKENLLDYDDLIEMCLGAEITERLLVDEAQDLTPLQFELIRKSGAEACFVGDDKQLVYDFRGASIDYFLRLPEIFNAEVERLKINYRNPARILEFANTAIRFNKRIFDFDSYPIRDGGEIEYIVEDFDRIAQMAAEEARKGKVLVLARHNKTLAEIRDSFARQKISCTMAEEFREKKTLLAEMLEYKLSEGASLPCLDSVDSLSLPMSKDDIIYHLDKCEDGLDVYALFTVIAGDWFRHEACEDISEFLVRLYPPHQPLNGNITVSTIHSAKGAEADTVFIVGFEHGLFPDDKSDIEAERRLLYVALTRAKQKVCIVRRPKRFPSMFATELGLEISLKCRLSTKRRKVPIEIERRRI